MKYQALFYPKKKKKKKKKTMKRYSRLSSAAVMIGTLRANTGFTAGHLDL